MLLSDLPHRRPALALCLAYTFSVTAGWGAPRRETWHRQRIFIDHEPIPWTFRAPTPAMARRLARTWEGPMKDSEVFKHLRGLPEDCNCSISVAAFDRLPEGEFRESVHLGRPAYSRTMGEPGSETREFLVQGEPWGSPMFPRTVFIGFSFGASDRCPPTLMQTFERIARSLRPVAQAAQPGARPGGGPGKPKSLRESEGLSELRGALSMIREGNLLSAGRRLAKAVEILPDRLEVLLARALHARLSGDAEAFRKLLQQAASVQPPSTAWSSALSKSGPLAAAGEGMAREASGDAAGALEAYGKAASGISRSWIGPALRAALEAELKECKAARRDLAAAADLNPSFRRMGAPLLQACQAP